MRGPVPSPVGLTCGEVNGIIYTVDAAGPLPCFVKDPTYLTAVGDMEAASNDAAGRTLPDASNSRSFMGFLI